MPGNIFAAIDMGTNSFHLIIAEVKKSGSFKIIDREREVIRLGSHEGKNLSVISPGEMDRAIEVLRGFKKLADSYNAEIRAAATSAVREAGNKAEFISKVLKETGIKVEAITGSREAELIYRGAEKALNLNNKKALCIDIGGGSSEYILTDSGKNIFAESIKIGAVRLSKKFFPGYRHNKLLVNECERYVENEIRSAIDINYAGTFEICAGTSGTIQSIALMIYAQKNNSQPGSLSELSINYEELRDIYPAIIGKETVEERLTVKGIEFKRADIIPAGLIILKKTFELLKINVMSISEYSLREGIILEMINSK